MASVVVMREEVVEVVEGGREWMWWIGMRFDRLPARLGSDPTSCWMDVLDWPVTRTSGSHQ